MTLAVGQTLLEFLSSLTEPVIPWSFHAFCASVQDRDQAYEVSHSVRLSHFGLTQQADPDPRITPGCLGQRMDLYHRFPSLQAADSRSFESSTPRLVGMYYSRAILVPLMR